MRYWTVATAILATTAFAMADEEHTPSLYAGADVLGDFEANTLRRVRRKKMMMMQSAPVSSLASPTAPPSSKSKSKPPNCSSGKGKGKGKGTGKGKGKGGSGDACADPTVAPGSPTSAPVTTIDATCELSAKIACKTTDGVDCSLYPSCFAATDSIQWIRLTYSPRPCSDSSNSQGSTASCIGMESLTNETVSIECINNREESIFSRDGI